MDKNRKQIVDWVQTEDEFEPSRRKVAALYKLFLYHNKREQWKVDDVIERYGHHSPPQLVALANWTLAEKD